MSDEFDSVHVLMGRVLDKLPAIGKDEKAPADMGGYSFRGIESITAALKPLFGEFGVYVLPETLDVVRTERIVGKYSKTMFVVDVHVRWTFRGPNGDEVRASTWGQGTDMGDKATQKAYTAAFKSLLTPGFLIADSETDAERHSVEETEAPPAAPVLLVAEQDVIDGLKARIAALSDELRSDLKTQWQGTQSLKAHVLNAIPAELVPLVESMLSGLEARQRASDGTGATESDAQSADAAEQPELAPAAQSAAEMAEAEQLVNADPPDDWVRELTERVEKMPAEEVDAELRNWSLPKSGNLQTRRKRLAVAMVRDSLRPPQ